MIARGGSRISSASSPRAIALRGKRAGDEGGASASSLLPLEYIYRHGDAESVSRAAMQFCDFLLSLNERGASRGRIRDRMLLSLPGRPNRRSVSGMLDAGAMDVVDKAADLYDALVDSSAGFSSAAAAFRKSMASALSDLSAQQTLSERAVHLLAALHASATR